MGLWSCCWRNWNIFNLARNQKKMERKKKHGGSYFLFQTYAESTNKLNVFVLQRYFPPAVTDSIFLSHFVLECLTARTASFGLEGKKQTWWLLIFLEVFSPCWHLQRDLALFYKEVFSNEQDPTCANSVCHLFQVRTVTKQTEVYSRDPVCLAKHSLSCTTQNSSTFLQPPPQSCILSLSLVPVLHSSAWKAGWAITRGLRAGWLPLIESSQQIVFHETALSSQPARTCPDITGDHTVSLALPCLHSPNWFLNNRSFSNPSFRTRPPTTSGKTNNCNNMSKHARDTGHTWRGRSSLLTGVHDSSRLHTNPSKTHACAPVIDEK